MKFKSLFTAATMLLAWGASAQCEFTELTLETTTGEWVLRSVGNFTV